MPLAALPRLAPVVERIPWLRLARAMAEVDRTRAEVITARRNVGNEAEDVLCMSLALFEMKVVLATVIREMDLVGRDGPSPRFVPRGLLGGADCPLHLRLAPRHMKSA